MPTLQRLWSASAANRGIGVSEAINDLVRAGLTQRVQRTPFEQRTDPIGLRVDAANVWEAIEQLDDPAAA